MNSEKEAFLTYLKEQYQDYCNLPNCETQLRLQKKQFLKGLMTAARMFGVSYDALKKIVENQSSSNYETLEEMLEIPTYIRKGKVIDSLSDISKIAPALLSAYKQTRYHVYSDPAFSLQINQKSAPLKALYKEGQCQSAAFITAFNPFSQTLNAKENAQRNQMLYESTVNQYELVIGKGIGEDEQHAEDSFLVLGIGLKEAKLLGKKYEQNAIVWAGEDAVPQLVLLA